MNPLGESGFDRVSFMQKYQTCWGKPMPSPNFRAGDIPRLVFCSPVLLLLLVFVLIISIPNYYGVIIPSFC